MRRTSIAGGDVRRPIVRAVSVTLLLRASRSRASSGHPPADYCHARKSRLSAGSTVKQGPVISANSLIVRAEYEKAARTQTQSMIDQAKDVFESRAAWKNLADNQAILVSHRSRSPGRDSNRTRQNGRARLDLDATKITALLPPALDASSWTSVTWSAPLRNWRRCRSAPPTFPSISIKSRSEASAVSAESQGG